MADLTTATGLMTAAILSALIAGLRERGILSEDDIIDLSDLALSALEEQRAVAASPDLKAAFDLARQMVEAQLKPAGKSPPRSERRQTKRS